MAGRSDELLALQLDETSEVVEILLAVSGAVIIDGITRSRNRLRTTRLSTMRSSITEAPAAIATTSGTDTLDDASAT